MNLFESARKTNNPGTEEEALGAWLSALDLRPEKVVLWSYEARLAHSLVEETGAEAVVGLEPDGSVRPYTPERIQIARTTSHRYTGSDFDLEYGWAIADDIINALEPQIEPEVNLHQYGYEDIEERELALGNAFSRIANTTDRLLKYEGATAVYNMDEIGRPLLPDLDEDITQNQVAYAERISSHLEKNGFETEVIEDPDFSRNVHLLGHR